MIDPTTFHMQKKKKNYYNNEHFWHFYPTFYVVQGSEVLVIMFLLYLMEAEEVLNGGGRVEDVAFSCHHQHEAAQRLEIENKLYHLRSIRMSEISHKHVKGVTWSSRSPSEKFTPSMEVTVEVVKEEGAVEVAEDGCSAELALFPPNMMLRSLE